MREVRGRNPLIDAALQKLEDLLALCLGKLRVEKRFETIERQMQAMQQQVNGFVVRIGHAVAERKLRFAEPAHRETQPVAQGDENGYPSMVWLQNCPLNKATGKPEITWFKAIQGNDSFYIVQVAFKAWPSKEQITQWMGYLKDVAVCDTRLPDRPCVFPGAGGPR